MARVNTTLGGKQSGRIARLAAAVVAGKSVAEAAREEGIGRTTASQAVNSAEGQFLVTTLVEAERVRIRDVFNRAIDVIAEAMQANRVQASEGIEVDCGADHYARLTAVKCLTGLLTAGRQPVRPEPPRRGITMDELRQLIRHNDELYAKGLLN